MKFCQRLVYTCLSCVFLIAHSVEAQNLSATAFSGTDYSGFDVSCLGASDGEAIVQASGGTAPYTYFWDAAAGNQANDTAFALAAGTYSVTVTDNVGAQVMVSVTMMAYEFHFIVSGDLSCDSASCSGSAGVAIIGGTAPYTYQWNDPALSTSATITGLCPGWYTCIVTDMTGCQSIDSAFIGYSNLSASVYATAPSCVGCTDGVVEVTGISGGTGPYNFMLYDAAMSFVAGGGAPIFGNLPQGIYVMCVTDGNGCVECNTVLLPDVPCDIDVDISGASNVSCNGGTDGTASSVVVSGTANTSYQWLDNLGNVVDTGATAANLAPGIYCVEVVDSALCTDTACVTILEPALLTIDSMVVTPVTCVGCADGSITAYCSGGVAGYSYLWPPFGATGPILTSLPEDTYMLCITDANGCTSCSSATVPVGSCNLDIEIANFVDVSCTGGSDGSATATVLTGTATSVDWYDGSWVSIGQSGLVASGLTAGTYCAVSTDSVGCTDTACVIISQPTPLLLTLTAIGASCGQANGSACVSVTGGAAPYYYFWAPFGGFSACLNNLPAGCYGFHVTDALGCVADTVICINDLGGPTISLLASANISCNGGSDGSISISYVGGAPPAIPEWYDAVGNHLPQFSGMTSIFGLQAGCYSCVITDSVGCVVQLTACLTAPSAMQISFTTVDPTMCNGSDGSACGIVTGGTPPYTYVWDDPLMQTTPCGAGFSNGTYTLYVTDANGCLVQDTVTLQPASPSVSGTIVVLSNALCNGDANGSAQVTASNGTPPYSYLWASGDTTAIINGLPAGTYCVVVVDSIGCNINLCVTITEPTPLTLTFSANNPTCGQADGIGCANVSGGTPPYTYLWDDPANQTTACASMLDAGVYLLTVTDANGCTLVAPIVLQSGSQPVASISSSTDVTCNGGADGSAIVSESGGTAPYTYLWSNGGTSSTVTGLSAGTYCVDVIDANGCLDSVCVTITEPTPLAVTFASNNPPCGQGGSACATVIGGAPPYTYLWDDPTNQTTTCATNLVDGVYTITVTDANGCTLVASIVLQSGSQPVASISSSTDVTCNGGADGSAIVSESGGTAPYTYLWSNGGTSSTVTGLSAGTYCVDVIDANGCLDSVCVTITEPTPLAVTFASNNPPCGQGGSACATVIGGAPPYTYLWDDPTNQTTTCATNLVDGVYTITVTDANGCTLVASIVLQSGSQPVASISSSTDVTCNGGADGSAIVSESGGTAPYTYLWSNGGTSSTVTGLSAGTYCVDVIDANGCLDSVCVTITEPAAIVLTASSIDDAGGACTGSATVLGTGGTGVITYLWDVQAGSQTTSTAAGLCAGTYCVTVTDADNCTVDTCVEVGTDIGLGSEIITEWSVSVYPNPFTNHTVLAVDGSVATFTLNIYDASGKLVRDYAPFVGQQLIDRTGLSDGLYFYQIIGDGGMQHGKLLVQ